MGLFGPPVDHTCPVAGEVHRSLCCLEEDQGRSFGSLSVIPAYLAEMAPKAARRLQGSVGASRRVQALSVIPVKAFSAQGSAMKAMKAMKYPAFQGANRLRRRVKEMKAGNYKVAFDSANSI